VLAVAGGDQGARARALSELCATYWPPLYAFARLQGLDRPSAEEVVQGFFADFLEREGFDRADVTRGRLRSYLLASLRHYLAHERDKKGARKRGTQLTSAATMDEIDAMVSGDASLDAEAGFMRVWAGRVLAQALAELRKDYLKRGKVEVFDTLSGFLVERAGSDAAGSAAGQLGMSAGTVKVALHRLRRRFGERLRAEVAHTVADQADVDAELKALVSAMSSL
jgi:RNA polymerase sigma-70 factor (ECF subfamily)